jgi:integrase
MKYNEYSKMIYLGCFCCIGGVYMNLVEPIKNQSDIELIKNELLSNCFRDYFLFVLGINTGMKISDLLTLKFMHLIREEQIVSFIHIRNTKYPINDGLRMCMIDYFNSLTHYSQDSYIFESRKGNEPIDRSHAYRIISDAAKKVGVNCNVGTQTLRKTYGYHHFKKHQDIKYLQKIFNHNSRKKTFDYIGVELAEIVKEDKEIYL